MKSHHLVSLVPIAVLLAAFAAACSGEATCEDNLTCGRVEIGGGDGDGDGSPPDVGDRDGGDSSNGSGGGAGDGDGGSAGNGGGVAVPDAEAAIGPCAQVPVDGCTAVVNDAVFVDPNLISSADGGSTDAGVVADGTIGNPVPTMQAAVAMAEARGVSRIVICQGTLSASVLLQPSDAWRSLEGGYDCDSWTFSSEIETKIQAAAPGEFALEIFAVTTPVSVRDLTFEAPLADGHGGSSIAVFVHESDDVLFENVTVLAGNGAHGADGTLEPFTLGDQWEADLDGTDAVGTSTADQKVFVCPDETQVRGGLGGRAYDNNVGDQCGFSQPESGLPTPLGGEEGFTTFDIDLTNYPISCLDGMPGSPAPPAAAGAGADAHGELSDMGWSSKAGEPGVIGAPGGGGGGGGGHARKYGNCGEWASGGAGALGGCGGNSGGPGQGGGASIALLVLDASVRLAGGRYAAANGGVGGDGAAGQVGQLGGTGGSGSDSGPNESNAHGCDGGAGGKGGDGGAGGGGAGGLAVSVLWSGHAPTLGSDDRAPAFSHGAPGLGGTSPGGATSSGLDGVAADILEATGPNFN